MRKQYLWAGTLLIAGASLLLLPAQAEAQRSGRGGRGGGGNRLSVGIGTGGAWVGYGRPSYGYGYGNGYGYGGYRSPYYYGSGWSGGYYDAAPSYYYESAPQPSYSYSEPSYSYQSGYPQENQQNLGTFAADVVAPADDAEVWFNGVKSTQRGQIRHFETSNLLMGRPYDFEVFVRWMENGQPREETRRIQGQAGQQRRVDVTVGQRQGQGPSENLDQPNLQTPSTIPTVRPRSQPETLPNPQPGGPTTTQPSDQPNVQRSNPSNQPGQSQPVPKPRQPEREDK